MGVAAETIAAAVDALASTGVGTTRAVVVAAPGRVNLVGEHTDYDGGLCLPAAIDHHVVAAAVSAPDALPGTDPFRFASADHEPGGTWTALARAVAAEVGALGLAPPAATVGFAGDVPEGAGLSSSAAFEVACGLALANAAGHEPDAMALAAACRRAEAAGLGVPCGPMDQIASCLGVDGGAVLIDCRSLETRPVVLPAGTAVIVVDSGLPRTLAGSGYADRVRECAAAAAMLGVESLRDVPAEDLAAATDSLPPHLARRVRHVVSENGRVLAAVAVCDAGGTVADLGALVDASHESLSRDHEVSLPAIDALAAACRSVPGVRGARIVGAGFGGAVLAVADAAAVDPDAAAAAMPAPAVVVHPGPGAHVLRP